MSTIRIQREPISALWVELWPLLEAHWQEIGLWRDIPPDPDTGAYESLEQAGMLRVFTVRADGWLVGYAAYVVRTHLHYRTSRQAVQDVIYLKPEHRRGRLGLRLIQHADRELAREGVQAVFQHVKTAHDFGPLLKRIGYQQVENVYARRL